LTCCVDGTTGYRLYGHGVQMLSAVVCADGRCEYNCEECFPDDPDFLALKAKVLPIQARPAAPVPDPYRRRPAPSRPDAPIARFARAGARRDPGCRGAHPLPPPAKNSRYNRTSGLSGPGTTGPHPARHYGSFLPRAACLRCRLHALHTRRAILPFVWFGRPRRRWPKRLSRSAPALFALGLHRNESDPCPEEHLAMR
jgi:hypothetical protein